MARSPLAALALSVLLLLSAIHVSGAAAGETENPYKKWKHGLSSDPGFFPISVWLQDPKNAPKYKAAGINLYIGLWKGPTEAQLAALKKAGMPVICSQNATGLKHKDDPIIVAWMHGDEPDNAQSRGKGKGYGPPVKPGKIIADYKKLAANDPTRPVILNLGQGVAWDGWHGRGVRTNHPEDYAEYIKGCDLVSFDIYPACHRKPEIAGKLWYVAKGVERLRKWSKDQKIVWDCIECTRISNPTTKATPHQVKAEVWMSLIHGSHGLIYFVHTWKPRFIEAGLLADKEMLQAVTAINHQIIQLAPVLNSPTLREGATVKSSDAKAPIAVMLKRHGGARYLFAVEMRGRATKGSFQVAGVKGKAKIEVLGEHRSIKAADGAFEDAFKAWDVHLYKIAAP